MSSSPAARRSSAPTTTDLLVAILEREPPSLRTVARGLPLQLEWIIEKSLEKDPNLRYQTIADLRVDLQRLKIALESGRLTSAALPPKRGAGRRCGRRTRSDRRQSGSRGASAACRGSPPPRPSAAAIVLGVAMSYYHLARPGADLPLQLPEGAVITKARDTIEGFGYSRTWARGPARPLSMPSMSKTSRAMAGLPAARDAIREGAPVAYWRAGITHTANPIGRPRAAAGDFSVRLDPRGQLVAFATGYATDGAIAHADRAKATSIGLEAIKKAFGIDASGFELEVVERILPRRQDRAHVAQPDARSTGTSSSCR